MFKKLQVHVEKRKRKALLKARIIYLCRHLKELHECYTNLDEYGIQCLRIKYYRECMLLLKKEKVFTIGEGFVEVKISILDKICINIHYMDSKQDCYQVQNLVFSLDWEPLVLDAASVTSLLCICDFIESVVHKEQLSRDEKLKNALKYIR